MGEADEFGEYGPAASYLGQRYRAAPKPVPSRALDEAILAAARGETAKAALSSQRSWLQGALLPLSFAATVLLTLGIVLQQARWLLPEEASRFEAAPSPPALEAKVSDLAEPAEAPRREELADLRRRLASQKSEFADGAASGGIAQETVEEPLAQAPLLAIPAPASPARASGAEEASAPAAELLSPRSNAGAVEGIAAYDPARPPPPSAKADPTAPALWLEAIRAAWQEEQRELAQRLWRRLRQYHPDLDTARLDEALGADVVAALRQAEAKEEAVAEGEPATSQGRAFGQ